MDYKIRGKPCSEWTVEELKKALKKRSLPVSGKKADLCERLRESYKPKKAGGVGVNALVKGMTKLAVTKAKAKQQLLPIDIRDASFRFYASLYYQKPGSAMAIKELHRYGLNKQYLDKFKNHERLFKVLST